ncbi:flavodoxin [Clostridium sporogenes]|uniref:flavodoxin n=1 Tax=Clostridium sporogenes TaxID=1509 RepID=UPI0013D7A25E|nr:flavodoxin [Clostridium sporogenes]EJP6472399.1 flavodoxin [Clostridium botulinum]NFV11578.1 flavodoxin [Clostridium sporogenes]
MNNLCIINGSPKKEKSNSNYLIKELTSLLDNNIKTKEYYIDELMKDSNLLQDIISFNKIIFVSPLYADCLPSTMLNFMIYFEEFLKDKKDLNIDVYCLINCGFLEGTQNNLAINILKNYCKKVGLNWRFGVGIGGGEFMASSKNMPLNCKMKMPVYNAFLDLKKDIENNDSNTNNSEVILVNAKMPKFIFKLAGNMSWKVTAKKNNLKSKDLYRRIY